MLVLAVVVGQILSEIGVLGPNLVDDNIRERSVKHQEGSTLAIIRGKDHALHTFRLFYVRKLILTPGFWPEFWNATLKCMDQ